MRACDWMKCHPLKQSLSETFLGITFVLDNILISTKAIKEYFSHLNSSKKINRMFIVKFNFGAVCSKTQFWIFAKLPTTDFLVGLVFLAKLYSRSSSVNSEGKYFGL